MFNMLRIFIGFILIITVLSGCAAIEKFNAPALISTPSASSLVVVKCDAIVHGIFDIRTGENIQNGVLLSTDGRKRIEGKAVGGLIIFSDVPPGDYTFVRVQALWQSGEMLFTNIYNIPPKDVSNFTINTKLGEPKFLGAIMIEDVRKPGEQKIFFELKPSKEIEIAAWEKFLQLYDKNSWTEEVQKRIAELKK